jgi:hypothetical protein
VREGRKKDGFGDAGMEEAGLTVTRVARILAFHSHRVFAGQSETRKRRSQ